jgi:hypothetical protein
MLKKIYYLLFLVIIAIAAYFRLHGVNWDQGQHLHPDERFLTMVSNAISWPESYWEYLNTDTSPLNPQNRGHNFFVYGTFPIFFTKLIAEFFDKGDYSNLTIVGRQLSALFDLGTVILVYLIAYEIAENGKRKTENKTKELLFLHASHFTLRAFPLLAMFFYACAVLSIQLSHFYAVDTYLTFFIALSFYFLIKIIRHSKYILTFSVLLGISFGLAVASKISAVYFSPIILVGYFYSLWKSGNKKVYPFYLFVFAFFAYFTIRFAQPYLFSNPNLFDITLNPKILDNWKQLESFNDKSGFFPPAVQWINTKPFIFPLKNLLFWGLGLPLGSLAIISVIFFLYYYLKLTIRKKWERIFHYSEVIIFLGLFWSVFLFIYQGRQFVKALRYFFPIYPFLSILSAVFFINIYIRLTKKGKFYKLLLLSVICYLLFVIIYPLSFMSIYSRLHSRVQASIWMYQNIPSGSIISAEHWDDGLPMSLPIPGFIHEKYPHLEFPLYGVDTKEKWLDMTNKLQKVDYIVLTSNRLYGSIMSVPEKYPITYKFYQLLFEGKLGFEKIAEFTSRPNLPLPFLKLCLTPPFARYGIVAKYTQECLQTGISFVDDYADETFTVYDHPKVIIFKKTKPVDYKTLIGY